MSSEHFCDYISEAFSPKFCLAEVVQFSEEKQQPYIAAKASKGLDFSNPKIMLNKHVISDDEKENAGDSQLAEPRISSTESSSSNKKVLSTAQAQAKRQKYKRLRAYRRYMSTTNSQENLQELEQQALLWASQDKTIISSSKSMGDQKNIVLLNYSDLVSNGLDRYRTNPFISRDSFPDLNDLITWVATTKADHHHRTTSSDDTDAFSAKYRIQELIGEGTYGKVYRCLDRNDTVYVAKVLPRADIRCLGIVECVNREIAINRAFCRSASTQFVTRFIEAIETADMYYLIFEHIIGRSLMTRVNMPFASEDTVRTYWVQLLEALEYIHSCGVFHGDLQLSNIMLQEKSNSIKLIDFGCANYSDNTHTKFTGNLFFAAPELLSGASYHGPQIDMWAAGVCLYKLLTGYLPFDRAADAVKVRFTVPLEEDDALHESAKDMLSKIFVLKGSERPTPTELLQHPWCQQVKPET